MKPIYLLCGVPGSGKTWVASQLTEKFNYVENDDFLDKDLYQSELIRESRKSEKPILATCPFAERELRDRLELNGVRVIPIFIVEEPQTVRKRYESREQRPIPAQHITRAISIKKRATDWRAQFGTSNEVLEFLRSANGIAD